MVSVGIDVGSLTTKVVVLDGDEVVYSWVAVSADDANTGGQKALEGYLRQNSMALEDLKPIGCTGVGRRDLSFAQVRKTIPLCLAKGTHRLFPGVRTIIDIGAETSQVVKINDKGQLEDSVVHDKCGAGTGTFLEAIAKVLHMSLEEMAERALAATARAEIGNTCAVFIEQEVISHLHHNPPTPVAEIIAGVFGAMAVRIMGMVKMLELEPDVAICGGVAKNAGLVKALEEELGVKVLVPENPQLVAALGAALLARERGNK